MAPESGQREYSDDEIEQILGMSGPELKLTLKEVGEVIRENPLLMTGLIFALGILIGAGLARDGRKCG